MYGDASPGMTHVPDIASASLRLSGAVAWRFPALGHHGEGQASMTRFARMPPKQRIEGNSSARLVSVSLVEMCSSFRFGLFLETATASTAWDRCGRVPSSVAAASAVAV